MADHDQRFKLLLREFFAEFLRLFFPEWAERFDFGRIEWLEQETFLDPPQGERRSVDLVAKLRLRQAATSEQGGEPEPWIALLHLEVEAPDAVASLRGRMYEYHQQMRTRHRLPALSIGLYLRVGLDGVGWDSYEESFWGERIIHFRYPYVGLPGLDAFDYVSGTNVLGAALAALMRAPEERRAELQAAAMERVATSEENEYRRYLLCECIEAYLPLEGPHLAAYERLLRTEPYEEASKMAVTSFEKGMVQGQRTLLERMLTQRFGTLSEVVLKRLAEWPEERLPELAVALLTAASLRELGLED